MIARSNATGTFSRKRILGRLGQLLARFATNRKDASLPNLISRLATTSCASISSPQSTPNDVLAPRAHEIFFFLREERETFYNARA